MGKFFLVDISQMPVFSKTYFLRDCFYSHFWKFGYLVIIEDSVCTRVLEFYWKFIYLGNREIKINNEPTEKKFEQAKPGKKFKNTRNSLPK